MLCSAAMDEGKREVRIISSVSYSFFFIYHPEPYHLASSSSISTAYIIIAWV